MREYLEEQTRVVADPTTTERSLYPELQSLLRDLLAGHPHGEALTVVSEARAEGVGVPDLRVARPGGRALGTVEVKPPGCSLEELQHSEQVQRYAAAFTNLLLTDGFRFRLLRRGEVVMSAGRLPALATGDLQAAGAAARQAVPEVVELLTAFLDHQPEPCRTLDQLVTLLADHARRLQSAVERQVDRERRAGEGMLAGLLEAFTYHLMPDLSPRRFADLYAQTLTFGLLAGRWWSTAEDPQAPFDRQVAWDAITPNLGLLQDLYRYVLLGDPPSSIRWILDDLVDLLATTDLAALFQKARRRDRDPILMFYEDFLRRYRPRERRRRGVFYTPEALVSFMVRSVDHLLEEELGYGGGLADPEVTVLDPAAGTLTFLVEAIHHAQERFVETYGAGGLGPEILDRFFAFELLVAPYALGHLKMGALMAELGSPLTRHQRFPLYLTNTLELETPGQSRTPGTGALAEEAHAALAIKRRPLTVILGNPPYFGHAASRCGRLERLLRRGYERADGTWSDGYYTSQGEPLREKNPKWLRDDYVQFFRFAQWKMDQADHGLVAFVTNHSFLDNPTFRGMRESLLESFDRVWVLDLHGNAKKREDPPKPGDAGEGVTVLTEDTEDPTAPPKDENVFEIRQGVAVTLMVKYGSRRDTPRRPPPRGSSLRRHDLWGSKRAKEAWLEAHDVATIPWRQVEPYPPGFYFLRRDRRLEERYRRFPAIDEIFQVGSLGLITGLDELVVSRNRRELMRRVERFHHAATWEDAQASLEDLSLSRRARERLDAGWRQARRDPLWADRVQPFLVRPFDHRWLFYALYLLERPRDEVMHHLQGGNRALVVSRQAKRHFGAFLTTGLTGHKVLDSYDGSYVFPLYLLPREGSLYGGETEANFDPALTATLGEVWGEAPHPETLFHYLYAVLHSATWRERYAEFLETAFPRVPFPKDRELFRRLSLAGEALARDHLLQGARDGSPARPTARLIRGDGEDAPGKLRLAFRRRDFRHDPDHERLVLSDDGTALTEVSAAVWRARIGSHRPLLSWLDSRRGELLSADDVRHLSAMVTALEHGRRHGEEVDRWYPAIEDDPAPRIPTPGPGRSVS